MYKIICLGNSEADLLKNKINQKLGLSKKIRCEYYKIEKSSEYYNGYSDSIRYWSEAAVDCRHS